MTLLREALLDMNEVDDPLSFAQAHYLMSFMCFYNREFGLGRRFFRRAVGTVRQHDIRFVPRRVDDTSPSPDYSEEVHERTSFLCELIHFSFHVQMLSGKPIEPLLDLHQQYRQDLKASVYNRIKPVFDDIPLVVL